MQSTTCRLILKDPDPTKVEHDEQLSAAEVSTLLKIASPGSAYEVAHAECIPRLMVLGFIRCVESMEMVWVELTEAGQARVDDELEQITVMLDTILGMVPKSTMPSSPSAKQISDDIEAAMESDLAASENVLELYRLRQRVDDMARERDMALRDAEKLRQKIHAAMQAMAG